MNLVKRFLTKKYQDVVNLYKKYLYYELKKIQDFSTYFDYLWSVLLEFNDILYKCYLICVFCNQFKSLIKV